MDSASAGMKSLCKEMRISSEDRKESIRILKDQVESIRRNAKQFLIDSKKFHKGMSKELRDDLLGSKRELIKMVSFLREDFKEKNRELKADLAEAGKVWREMINSLEKEKAGLKQRSEVRQND